VAGENLIYTFGGDASKLNAEIKFVGQNLKQLDREISAAFKSGNIAQARQLSEVSGTMQTKFVGLNRELKGTAAGLDKVTAAGGRMRLQFRNLGGSIETIAGQLGKLGGGLVGGLIGGAVISGVREVTKALDDQIERIVKIRDLARDTARSPASVAAAQNIARAAGESEDTANKALQRQAANFAELERRRIGLGAAINQTPAAQAKQQELMQQRARLLGGGFFDASKDEAIDLSKVYEILVGNVARFKGNAEAAANFVDKSFLQLVRTGRYSATQYNEIAKQLYDTNKDAAIKLATANIEKYNAELAKTQNTTNNAVSDAEKLAEAQGKLANQYNESTTGITSAYAKLKTAGAEAATEILKGGVTGVLQKEGERQIQDAQNQKDANILIWNTLADAAVAAGQKIKDAFQSFGAGGGAFGDPSTPAMPTTPIKDEFDKLPPYFQGIGQTISDVWKATFGSIIGTAEAAEVRVSASAKGMSASFVVAAKDIQNAMSAALGAVNSLQGGASMAQGAASFAAGARPGGGSDFGVQVFRGGIGDQGGHGPASFATQSITPGLSDYQAPPPKRIDISYAGGGAVRGPGTGTSDSIMARLSNGEFVMRAAAVRHWGAGFMSNLNRFAGGGMVMPSRGVPSFADGGLVAAGGGTGRAVHLHLGGHEFALSGASGVVDSLVTAANQQRMRSGGLKPSWYGGRASG
jgi:hypothetical protein